MAMKLVLDLQLQRCRKPTNKAPSSLYVMLVLSQLLRGKLEKSKNLGDGIPA